METRCIQKTGGSSFTLTLPKSWVVQNQLEQNGIVEIHVRNTKQLIIQPRAGLRHHTAQITIDYLPDTHIVRELIGMYLSGAHEVVITAKTITYEQRSLIRSTASKLIGFELFEESSNRILLTSVANPTITAVEYIKKMFGIIQSMFSDLVHAMDISDTRLARDIIDRDVEIDRIQMMILRQFNIMLNTIVSDQPNSLSTVDLHYYEFAAMRLERIADHIVRIASFVSSLKGKEQIVLNKFEHANLLRITKCLEALQKIIFTLDKHTAHTILDRYSTKKKNEYINTMITNTPSINILIQNSIERIRSYVANIAEETINYLDIRLIS